MKRLFLDLGNTRVKWWLEAGEINKGVLEYAELVSFLQMMAVGDFRPDQVITASVIKDQRYADLMRTLSDLALPPPLQCKVSPFALGVNCAYKDYSRLGIDRWLAVLAGWWMFRQAFVVVDLGTAATVDFVDDNGTHLGGFIIPGLRLGIKGLIEGTSNVAVDTDKLQNADLSPGIDTTGAVYQGALFSMVSMVENARDYLVKLNSEAKLLITGGDAVLVGSHLRCHYQLIEDLVFNGMQLMANQSLVVEAPQQD